VQSEDKLKEMRGGRRINPAGGCNPARRGAPEAGLVPTYMYMYATYTRWSFALFTLRVHQRWR
jgi:hypothetical protein